MCSKPIFIEDILFKIRDEKELLTDKEVSKVKSEIEYHQSSYDNLNMLLNYYYDNQIAKIKTQ